jgi:hypothetical protein
MKNFEEWEITYKVILANPIGCKIPIQIIHEYFDEAVKTMASGNKVAIGRSTVNAEVVE